MKNIERWKQVSFWVGAFGFLTALFLLGQTLGLGMQNDNTQFIGSGIAFAMSGTPTIFDELASRYLFISVSFLLITVFGQLRPNIISTILNMIPILFIFIQFRLLVLLKTEVFQVNWPYLRWLRETYYCDFFIVALTLVLLLTSIARFGLKLRIHSAAA